MDDRPRVSPASYLLLALGSLSYFWFLFVWFLLPAFLTDVIAALGLSNTQAGLVAGAIQLIYIPLALVSGLLVDRIGAPNAVAIGLAVVGGSQALRATAPGFPTLLVATLALGVGGTGVTFGLPKLVSELFPASRTGSMSAVYVVGASFGTATAFGVARPYLGPLVGGWRALFWTTGLLVVAYAVVWFVAARLLWARADRFGSAPTQSFSLDSIRTDVHTVVAHPQLRLLVLVGTMQLFVTHGTQAWLETVLEARGLTVGVAAAVTSFFVLARIAGTATIPALSDRARARRAAVVGCGALAALGGVGFLVTGASVWPTVAVVGLLGLGMGGLSPLIRALPIELEGIGPRLTATANGLIFTVGEVGGFGGPFLVGSGRDAFGSYLPGFAAFVVASLVVVAAGYAIEEPTSTGE